MSKKPKAISQEPKATVFLSSRPWFGFWDFKTVKVVIGLQI